MVRVAVRIAVLGSFCPCLIGLYEQVAAAELVSLGPQAFPGHHEYQVAVQAAELRGSVTRHPQVDVPGLGVELGDVTVGVQEWVIPHVRILVARRAVEGTAVSPKRRWSRRGW